MCHRFLPIDRYNKYQSNQIYRFLSIDFSGSIPLYGHCANCKHCTHCENGRFLLIRSLVTTKSQLAFELQSSRAFEKCSNAWRSSKYVWVGGYPFTFLGKDWLIKKKEKSAKTPETEWIENSRSKRKKIHQVRSQ